MNTSQKLFDQMARNPMDWRLSDLQTVAQQHGIVWRQKGSSHCVFARKDGHIFVVPTHRPIQPIYIRKFARFVKGDE